MRSSVHAQAVKGSEAVPSKGRSGSWPSVQYSARPFPGRQQRLKGSSRRTTCEPAASDVGSRHGHRAHAAARQGDEGVKGIGDAAATKIISNRPYKSLDDLGKAGLSAKKIEKLRPYLTVGGGAASAAAPASVPAAPAPVAPAAAKSAAPAGSPASPKLAPGQKVSLNSASLAELESLPGIGPKKAQAIIDGRPYKAIEDVMKVKGIKQGTFGKIKDHITVD